MQIFAIPRLYQEFSIEIVVDDITAAAEIIRSMDGQTLSASMFQHEAHSTADFVKAIAWEDINRVLAALRGLGNVHFESEHVVNMSDEVTDLQARLIANAQEIERLQDMLAASENLNVLIAVDARLSQTEWDRDWLLGRLNEINARTAFPYVNITLRSEVPLPPDETLSFGQRVANAFTTSASGFASAAASFTVFLARVMLPLVVLAVIALIVWRIVRRVLKKSLPTERIETQKEETPQEDDTNVDLWLKGFENEDEEGKS